MLEVKGNGDVVSREIPVSSFIRLHLAGKGRIELIASDEEKIVVVADENLQEYVEAVNSGRTLYVSTTAKFRDPLFTDCRIQVHFRQIDTLCIRCDGGDVVCPGIIRLTQPVKIKIQSVGNTDLHLQAPYIQLASACEGNVVLRGECTDIDIRNQSVGNLDTRALTAQDLSIRNMAEGNVELFAENTIAIRHYGEGYIHYGGKAVLKEVKQYGEGEIKHYIV
jgi:Putative auto-transporter adhesin, head GIN domain